MSGKDGVVIRTTLSMMCITVEATLIYIVYSTGLVFGLSFVTVFVTAVFTTLAVVLVRAFYRCWLWLKYPSSRTMTDYEVRAATALIDADCTAQQTRAFVSYLS